MAAKDSLVPGLVSFKLGSYSPENSELKLKVLVRPVGGEEKHISSLIRSLDKSTPGQF